MPLRLRKLLVLLSLASLLGCAGSSSAAGSLRFKNQPIAWSVAPPDPIPKPAFSAFHENLDIFDSLVYDRVMRRLSLPKQHAAANTNALDEVPDSSWFTNRIGVRPVAPSEIRLGPGGSASNPELHRPWTIQSSKVGGSQPGFIIQDAAGRKYILKFDDRQIPFAETSSHVVVQRILWACGYYVPDDRIVHFAPHELVLGEGATVKDMFGNKKAMTQQFVEETLSQVALGADGRHRALASRFLDGVVGGFAPNGTRGDDANDRIPHQHRRELRGLQPIAAWLAHTDIKEGNTLDVWVEAPVGSGTGHLLHYWVDFGKALGVMALTNYFAASGFESALDGTSMFTSLLSLGLWHRPHDGLRPPVLAGVGMFESQKFRPDLYSPSRPYLPFVAMTRADGFWGAKLLMRFTREQLAAAVAEAEYPSAASANYVLDTLVARQKKAANYWFSRVSPLDQFEMTRTGASGTLCFLDLASHYRLPSSSAVPRYRAALFDYEGHRLGLDVDLRSYGEGRLCLESIPLPAAHQGYVILHLQKMRGKRALSPVRVHAAMADDGTMRIVGIERP